jgi:CubicO group peptidase (beta-lactamase class C family)
MLDRPKQHHLDRGLEITHQIETGARSRSPVAAWRLAELMHQARRDVESGVLPACQIAVARDGELLMSATYDRDRGELQGDAPRFCVFSITKPFVSGVVWQLIDEGTIALGDRVADVIPEFATNGKEVVTLEQLLTHTAGFPNAPLAPDLWNDRQGRVRRFGSWRLDREPGTGYAYHATSAHWVLAELIDRLTGDDFRTAVKQRILDPIGLRRFQLGVPPGQQADIYRIESVGVPPDPDALEERLGIRELPREVTDEALLRFNEPEARQAGVPGAGGVSTAADVAMFYQELNLNSRRLWSAELLHDVRANIRVTMPDPMVGVAANRTIGLIVKGDDGLGHKRHSMGRTTSARTFGHSGAGGQIAWADPETGLSFCYLVCGLDRDVLSMGRRSSELSTKAGALLKDR